MKTIWTFLRKHFDPSYYLDVDGYPKDLEYTHITSWPIVPKGMKTKLPTFKKLK